MEQNEGRASASSPVEEAQGKGMGEACMEGGLETPKSKGEMQDEAR